MKRFFDGALALALIISCCIPMLIIAVLIKLTSRGMVLYWSDRVGKDNVIFKMPKFRTMRTDTPPVATHLLENPGTYLTPVGSYLRRFSLDELPQLWSIITGNMAFVGPRPALYNQEDLIHLRTDKGVHRLTPGVTGWAQVNGRDSISITLKVELDEYYLQNKSFLLDMKILWMTLVKVLKAENVKH